MGRGYEPLETPLKQQTWPHIWNQYAERKLEVGENIPGNIIERSVNLVVFTSLYYFENFGTLDALRYYLYARRQTKVLPPAEDALRQHVLRSLYQTPTWVQATQHVPAILEPFTFGWKSDTTGIAPLLTTKANVPDSLLTASFCKCKKGCTRKCLWKEKVLTEAACQCTGSAKLCARVQVQQDTRVRKM